MTLLELPYGQGALPFHAPSERLEAVLRDIAPHKRDAWLSEL